MIDDDVRSAANQALRSLRAAGERKVEAFESRRVHLIAGMLALAGTTAVFFGFWPPLVNPKPGGWSHTATALFFGGLVTMAAAKIACLFDRGTLVGTRPIKTALMSDGMGWLGIGWIHLEPWQNPVGHMMTMGFAFSMSVFAFYWQEAAGSWRLKHLQKRMHSTMIAFLLATGIGTLLMLALSGRHDAASDDRFYLAAFFLATMGAMTLALILWFWGLVGLTTALLKGHAGRSAPSDGS